METTRDPQHLLDSLRADEIRAKLADVRGLERALKVLLRAAEARERYLARRAVTEAEVAPT